jgi:uncharacterized membrane protein YuzA (DUF378 family)
MGVFRKVFDMVSLIAQLLVLIGALNWGLMGINKTDAIVVLFPRQFVRYVHLAVGVAALFLILARFF